MKEIKHVAVIGGGIMGAGIAALFANQNIEASVYDLNLELASKCLEVLSDPKAKIPLIYSPKLVKYIKPYAIDQYPEQLPKADMIIEVVPEIMSLKNKVFKQIDQHRKKGSIVCTNTSGLSVNKMVEGCSEDMQAHFLGTHYFNPVRFLPLVELIPCQKTQKEVVHFCMEFFRNAGKKPVVGKDTPNFIANRIGIFQMMKTLQLMQKYGFNVETIDMLTGSSLGNPKTATFRLSDMVGVDTLVHASKNSYDNCLDDEARDIFNPPEFLNKMVEQKLLGDKTKKGFYQKVGKAVSVLNLKTMEYAPKQDIKNDCVRVAKTYTRPVDRIYSMMTYGDDAISKFSKEVVMASAAYALNRVGEVADDLYTIDNAMKWGFAKEVGLIEILNHIGLEKSAQMMEESGVVVPKLLKEMIATTDHIYEKNAGVVSYFDVKTKKMVEDKIPKNVILLENLKETNKIVRENLNSRLIDLGDGILLVELDAKMVPNMNPIDDYVISMMAQAFQVVKKGFKGVVISNQAQHFCAGAQLQLILEISRAKRFKELLEISKGLQMANIMLHHADFPVVTAPHGMTLGGGMEITLAGQKRVAYAELYGGLVEVGVGLLPGGAGCLLLTMQLMNIMAKQNPGPLPVVFKAFDLIGFGRVSMSALDAMEKGFLTEEDVIVLNKDELISRAKAECLKMAEDFKPIPEMDLYLPGMSGYYAMEDQIKGFTLKGDISPHSAKIAKVQAKVLCGGEKASLTTPISEEEFLELEREAFVSLCGEKMSQERMEYMLKKGKPLIN